MFGSVQSKLIVGSVSILIIAMAPALVGLAWDQGESHMTLEAGLLLSAIGVGSGIVVVMSRLIAKPLSSLTRELRALADEAKVIDAIATVQRNLDANLDVMRRLTYGRGDPVRVGDKLYFGDVLVNDSNDIVDEVQRAHGGAATIFLGDLRISTNVKDKGGARMTGTRLAPGPAFDATLKEGKSFRGEAELFGEAYITIYEPILIDREIIGIIFVAAKKAEILDQIAKNRAAPSAPDFIQLARNIKELREVTVGREGLMRESVEKTSLLADARRRSEARDRAAAMAQRDVVGALSTALEKLAGADLTHRIDMIFPSEYQKLKDDFGAALSALRETMRAIMDEAQSMRGHSTEIAQAVDELSRRTEQQAASLEETAAALDLITATVKRTALGVDNARKVVTEATTDAEHSSVIVQKAVEAMSAIEESSKKIGQIISVIDDIALQTNLLALNAGVEAARAGDAGRGFAVVASEVRALAQRSAEAAKEIKTLISASTQQVATGVSLVGDTGRSLERIVTQVSEVNTIVAEIAAAAQEQSTSLQEVNIAINQMDQATQQNAAMVEESTAASHHLAQEAGKLQELVGQFQTGAVERIAPALSGMSRPAARHVPVPVMKTVSNGKGAAARKPSGSADADWQEF